MNKLVSDPLPQPNQELTIDGQTYMIHLLRQHKPVSQSTRLAIPAYLPNQTACEILDVCIRTIQRYTQIPYELWIVDNNSPQEHARWLYDSASRYSHVNVVLNRTEPIPPGQRNQWAQLVGKLRGNYHQQTWGSYANAIGLEIAVRLLSPETPYLMTLHMDTMPCHSEWLPFLLSTLSGQTAAAGVRLEKGRVPAGVLHVLGLLVDFQQFRACNLDFFPKLPKYDVGDRITVELQKAGYTIYACANTHTDPQVEARIPANSPYAELQVDRTLDDTGNVIFLHLGRGVPKSANRHTRGVLPEEWINFAKTHLLA